MTEPNTVPPDIDSPDAQLFRRWRQDDRIDVAAFLSGFADLAPTVVVAVLLVDQRERWRMGERIPSESYLLRFPALEAEPEAVVELVYGEYLLREDGGERPALPEYQWRFPQHAARLRQQIELHRALDGASTALTLSPVEQTTLNQPPAVSTNVSMASDYEILEELGRGGMGVVYKARQVKANRVVALKMILAGGHAAAAELDRFRREARAIARLQHPNIVQIFEVGEHHGLPFFSLEFCPGGGLDRKLGGAPISASEAAALVEPLALAMQAVHQKGILHRDLKPANILLSEDGAPRITDFGLARLDETNQTRTGSLMGTPSYMAPEQAQGKTHEMGPWSDVYSLGAILYECLTGRPPFRAATYADTIRQVVDQEPAPPCQLNGATPRDLETICLKCLSREPLKRYATALELAEDLARFQAGLPVRARPVGKLERSWRLCRRNPIVAAASAAAVLLLVAVVVVSVVFGVEQGNASRRVQAEKDETERMADQWRMEKDRAEAALTQSRTNEALLTCGRALRICEEGEDGQISDPYRGLLWLTRALELAPADDATLQYLLRTNWAAWQTRICPLRGTLSLAAPSGGRFATWSPNGRQVVVGSPTGLEIWDAFPWRKARTLPFPERTTNVAWSPDGRQVASSGLQGGPIRIWRLESDTVQKLTVPANVNDLNFSVDSTLLAAACSNGEVFFWDAHTGAAVGKPLSLKEPATSVSFHPDGTRFLTSTQNTLQQWDMANRTPVGPLLRGSGPGRHRFQGARYSTTGKLFSVMEIPGEGVFVHKTKTGRLVGRFPLGLSKSVHHLSPDDKHLVIGTRASRADVIDAASGSVLLTIPGLGGTVTAASYAPDGRTLLTASSDGTVRLSALPDDLLPASFPVAFSAPRPASAVVHHQTDGIRRLAVHPNGKWLFVGGWDKDGLLLSLADGSVRGKITGHDHVITAAACTPDGARLLTGDADGKVCLWNADTGRLLQGPWRLRQGGPIGALSISPDGSLAAVRAWNSSQLLALGGVKRDEAGGLSPAFWGRRTSAAAFVPTGKFLLVAKQFGAAELWDVEQRKKIALSLNHTTTIWAVATAASGKRAATGAYGVGQIWDLRTGLPIGSPLRNKDWFVQMAFSPDSRLVASLGMDGEARFWDAATGKAVGPALKHPGPGNTLVFHPDGSELLTAGSTNRICRWRVPQPVAGDVARLRLQAQVLTGMELDAEGVVHVLDTETWRERCKRLEAWGR